MTILQDKHHDPRTYRVPPTGKPAPEAVGSYFPCARKACETRLDATYVAPEGLKAFAEAHGFIESGGQSYCSKRCSIMHAMAPDGAGKVAEPAKPLKTEALRIPSRVNVVSTSNGTGGLIHYAACCLHSCLHRFEIGDPATAAKAAAVQGYVETSDGVFCSASCARRGRTEVEAGMQAPMPLTPAVIAETKAEIEQYPAKPENLPPPVQTAAQVVENRKSRRERDRIAAALAK